MIISIASGKGGTGKTLIATSLALSLEKETVQLLDCDVEEPNAHLLLKPTLSEHQPVCIPVPDIDIAKCTYCGKCSEVCVYHSIAVLKNKVLVFPELCHGCGACMYLCPENAITEKGRETGIIEKGHANGIEFVHGKLNIGETMAPPVIREVKKQINTERIVLLDSPPGTSCPVVESIRSSNYCLLVTEPTPFGLNDLVLAVEVVKQMNIPHGVVVNRAGVGDSKIEEYCRDENIPILLNIPLDIEIARLYSRGITLTEGKPEWREPFLTMFNTIKQIIATS